MEWQDKVGKSGLNGAGANQQAGGGRAGVISVLIWQVARRMINQVTGRVKPKLAVLIREGGAAWCGKPCVMWVGHLLAPTCQTDQVAKWRGRKWMESMDEMSTPGNGSQRPAIGRMSAASE